MQPLPGSLKECSRSSHGGQTEFFNPNVDGGYLDAHGELP